MLLCAGAMLFACSAERVAGTTNTGNARIDVEVPGDAAALASNSALKSILITAKGDSLLDSRKGQAVDSNTLRFDKLPSGAYVLVITDNAGGLSTTRPISVEDKKEYFLQLSPGKPIAATGRVLYLPDSAGGNALRVWIPGISRAEVKKSGVYSFQNIPAGRYDLAFSLNGVVNYLSVETGPHSGDTAWIRDTDFSASQKSSLGAYSFFETTAAKAFAVRPKNYLIPEMPEWYRGKDFGQVAYFNPLPAQVEEITDTLMIDRFERDTVVSYLSDAGFESFWYLITGNNTRWAPGSADTRFADAYIQEGQNHALHLTFFIDPETNVLPPGFGVAPKRLEDVDLSGMRSLSFLAKGKGGLTISFPSRTILDYGEADQWGFHRTAVTLTSRWQRFRIFPEDLALEAGSLAEENNLAWDEVNSRIYRINFLFEAASPGDTTEVYFDEPAIEGLTIWDL